MARVVRDASFFTSADWTPEAMARARGMLQAGVSAADVGAVLQCSEVDVAARFPTLVRQSEASLAARGQVRVRELSLDEVKVAATLAAYGAPRKSIAALLGVTIKVLETYCGDAMDLAVVKINAHVARALFDQVRAGNVTAQMFWLKTRGGPEWRETQHISVEGQVGVLVAPGRVDPDAWIEGEAARTGAATPQAMSAAREAARASAVSSLAAGEVEGAVSPWAGDADVGDVGRPMADVGLDLMPLREMALPDPFADDEALSASIEASEDAEVAGEAAVVRGRLEHPGWREGARALGVRNATPAPPKALTDAEVAAAAAQSARRAQARAAGRKAKPPTKKQLRAKAKRAAGAAARGGAAGAAARGGAARGGAARGGAAGAAARGGAAPVVAADDEDWFA